MKVKAVFENVDIQITDDQDKVVYAFKALDYRFEADSIGLIKAVEEHIPAIKALVEKIENA